MKGGCHQTGLVNALSYQLIAEPLMAGVQEGNLRKPDFFIVGAPRCGTTAMYDYLAQHPEVFMSPVKEPHFFGGDVNADIVRHDEAHYLALFQGADPRPGSGQAPAKRVGEASAWYLYSQTAAQEIDTFCPDPRIIAMLRNPLDMMYSLHGIQAYEGFEDIRDFAAALDAEEDRKQGRRIPPSAHSPRRLFYREIARYADQLERYFRVFGRERVLVIIYDDLVADTEAVYRDALRFLDVEDSYVPDFQVKNAHKSIQRSGIWKSWRLAASAPGIASAYRALVPPSLRQRARETVRRFYSSPAPRLPMDATLQLQLSQELAPQVERVSELLGRDLTHWCSYSSVEV